MQMMRGGSWLGEAGGGDYGVFGVENMDVCLAPKFAGHLTNTKYHHSAGAAVLHIYAQFAQTGTVLQCKICTMMKYFGTITHICTAATHFAHFAISKGNTIILRASAEQQEAFAIKRDATLEEAIISNPFFLFLNLYPVLEIFFKNSSTLKFAI